MTRLHDGPLLLDHAVEMAAPRPFKTRTAPRPSLSGRWLPRLLFGVMGAYALVARPWQLRWGATAEEASTTLPGDHLVPDAAYVTTRAITVQAAAEAMWPWLVQLGQGRAGFYTYDRLEQIVGAAIRSADHIVPELQRLTVGDTVKLSPVGGPKVAVLDPGHALVPAAATAETLSTYAERWSAGQSVG